MAELCPKQGNTKGESHDGSSIGPDARHHQTFGGVTALQDVNLEAYAGEVLAIVGDNGAGKSTLIKILTGVYQPSEGEIFLDGQPLEMASHSDAIAQGIDAVYQTLALADHLTPAANMFLGTELTRKSLRGSNSSTIAA